MTSIELEPFTAAHLPVVQPWFEHPEVDLRLGGPEWPARGLALDDIPQDDVFRGMRVRRSHTWLASYDGVPVGYLGGEVYDRWTTWDGEQVTAWEPGPAMGSAYVVDPARWREGLGSAVLRAWLEAPEVEDVVLFALGIDDDNVASRRCAERAGFRADDEAPDWEGIVYFTRRITGRRARP